MDMIRAGGQAASLRDKAKERLEAGDFDGAFSAFEALARITPGDVRLRMELADLTLRRGQMRAATRWLLEAVQALPNDVQTISELGWRLAMTGEIAGARRCADHLERAPDPPGWVLAEQAHLRWTLGDIPAARAKMSLAAKAGLETREQHYMEAMLLQFTGRLASAERALLHLLERWPDHGDAAVILVNLRRQTKASHHLDLLLRLVDQLPPAAEGDRKRALMHAKFESAIFKVLDDLGQYAAAWRALQASNNRMHALFPYATESEAAVTDAIIEASSRMTSSGAVTPTGPTPIFVVGMPRSGSTLLDQMLSAHSEVISAGEINDFQRQLHWAADIAPRGNAGLMRVLERIDRIDFSEVGARYLMQTQWRACGHRFYVDKLPINIRMVPFIRRALPHAPILHLTRDPMDVCYSNLKIMFGSASPYCYDLESLAHYHGQYTRLVEHWQRAWPGAMLDIAYVDLVSRPKATLSRVLSYCGLAFEEACLHPERNRSSVATPSAAQVREPVNLRSVGQWKRYAEHLIPLERALGC